MESITNLPYSRLPLGSSPEFTSSVKHEDGFDEIAYRRNRPYASEPKIAVVSVGEPCLIKSIADGNKPFNGLKGPMSSFMCDTTLDFIGQDDEGSYRAGEAYFQKGQLVWGWLGRNEFYNANDFRRYHQAVNRIPHREMDLMLARLSTERKDSIRSYVNVAPDPSRQSLVSRIFSLMR